LNCCGVCGVFSLFAADENEMRRIVDVNTGEVEWARGEAVLRSLAIGSCVVIAAYDCQNGIGGMAHVMLPGRASERASEPNRYAANAIDNLLGRMIEAGANQPDIEVCLVGAGNVLEKADDAICGQNIRSVTGLLRGKNVAVKGSVLGGTERKAVFLDVESGTVTYTRADEKEKLLWKPATSPQSQQQKYFGKI